MRFTVLVRAALLGSAAVLFTATPAAAQDAPPPADPAPGAEVPTEEGTVPASAETRDEAAAATDTDIVVTARRRSEILLDVPIAVTAYSGEQLARQGALDITDIGDTTPNVTVETSRGTNTTLTAFIRGVGQQDPVAGFEQGVGLYLDDVYLNRPQGALLDIYNVERIEVLRGPQGTLYGRNTIGGAIKYVTRRLGDVPEASVRTNIGSYNQLDLIMSASTPIAAGLKIGGAVARLSRDGFGDNLTTGKENYNRDLLAGRATLEFEPAGNVFLRLSGDYSVDESNPRGGHRLVPNLCTANQIPSAFDCNAPFAVLGDEFDSRGSLNDPRQKVRGGGITGLGEIGLTDWLKLRSITAWRKDRSDTPIDFDALPFADLDVPAIYKNRQFSQEVQLVVDRGPLAGLVGVYYLEANANNIFDVRLYTTRPTAVTLPSGAVLPPLPGLTASTFGDVDTRTWAAFGDFTYDITEQFSVSAGLRYTSDKRHAVVLRQTRVFGGQPGLGGSQGFGVGTVIATTSSFDGKRKDTAWTPRASVSFKPTRDHNIYASYARGFKGGGFDPRGQTTLAPDLDLDGVREPEEIYDFMAFDPETVDSYELGWKGSVFERRLNFAVAAFLADYEDVQVPGSAGQIVNGVPNFTGVTTNAGKARFKGIELESNLRIAENLAIGGDRLNFAGTLGYLDAEYREFITLVEYDRTTGARLPRAIEVDVADFREVQNTPKWTMSGSLDYDTPAFGGRLNANTTLSYRSSSQQFELRVPGLDQEGFSLLDANLVWRSLGSRFTIGLHGKNLTDKRYITSGYVFLRQNPYTGEFINLDGTPGLNPTLGRTGVLTGFYGPPRQIWLSLGANF